MYTGNSEEIKRVDIVPVLKEKIKKYYEDLKENKVIFVSAKHEGEEGAEKEQKKHKK